VLLELVRKGRKVQMFRKRELFRYYPVQNCDRSAVLASEAAEFSARRFSFASGTGLAGLGGSSETKTRRIVTMKRLTTLMAVCAVFVLTLSLTTFAQAPQNPPAANPPAAQQAPPSAEKTFSGQLSKVDATAKEITLKSTDNKEMIFSYNDQTKMTGVDNGAQGLAGKTGANLKITYRENRGANLATQIEVQGQEKK
jgi:Cu/Ag efflux protein CusF